MEYLELYFLADEHPLEGGEVLLCPWRILFWLVHFINPLILSPPLPRLFVLVHRVFYPCFLCLSLSTPAPLFIAIIARSVRLLPGMSLNVKLDRIYTPFICFTNFTKVVIRILLNNRFVN